MKVLYIDASNSGISGDMFLAALLSLVPNHEKILRELKELTNFLSGVSKLEIELTKITRSGIQLNMLAIEINESKKHRTPKILKEALNNFMESKSFTEQAKLYANSVLNSLIQAESEVHGELEDKLHLHELSSVDTLIDIAGVSSVLDTLGAFKKDFKISCSKLPLGGGSIKTAHGILPVPAPATIKILEKSNLHVLEGPIESELVTPTGAALLSNLKPEVSPYSMNLDKVSYSTGQKHFKDFLNMMRLFYGDTEARGENHQLSKYLDQVTVLETNVDDVSGEILGDFIKNLENEDILDFQVISSTTKKNRPGHLIKVLCNPEQKFDIIEKIITELGTLGVRVNTIDRVCVERKIESKNIEIDGKEYEVNYKISYIASDIGQKIVNIKAEYEDLRKISKQSGFSIKRVQIIAQSQIQNIIESME